MSSIILILSVYPSLFSWILLRWFVLKISVFLKIERSVGFTTYTQFPRAFLFNLLVKTFLSYY